MLYTPQYPLWLPPLPVSPTPCPPSGGYIWGSNIQYKSFSKKFLGTISFQKVDPVYNINLSQKNFWGPFFSKKSTFYFLKWFFLKNFWGPFPSKKEGSLFKSNSIFKKISGGIFFMEF